MPMRLRKMNPPKIPGTVFRQIESLKRGFPSIKGVVETTHFLPGRIRLNVPALLGEHGAADNLALTMNKLEQVKRIDADPVTGSVLMEYQSGMVDPVILVGTVIRILNIDKDLAAESSASAQKFFTLARESIDCALGHFSFGVLNVKSAVMILLLSAIGYSVLRKQAFTLSPPIILSWWAYNHLYGLNT